MDDARKISVKNEVFRTLAVARDQYQSAGILYESKKYHASLPFLRNAVMYGVKALLMLDHDDLPDDSGLINTYNQTDISKNIRLSFELKEILARLDNVQKEGVIQTLKISKRTTSPSSMDPIRIFGRYAKGLKAKSCLFTINKTAKKRMRSARS